MLSEQHLETLASCWCPFLCNGSGCLTARILLYQLHFFPFSGEQNLSCLLHCCSISSHYVNTLYLFTGYIVILPSVTPPALMQPCHLKACGPMTPSATFDNCFCFQIVLIVLGLSFFSLHFSVLDSYFACFFFFLSIFFSFLSINQ